jgi:hypothetical protein
VVPQDAPAAIAAAVREAFLHREGLAEMGESGRRHALSRYARPVVTAEYDALIGQVLRERAA